MMEWLLLILLVFFLVRLENWQSKRLPWKGRGRKSAGW